MSPKVAVVKTLVEQALAEVQQQIDQFTPELEGIHDFRRLNLPADTQQQVFNQLEVYDRRMALLANALGALQALLADGHPGIAPLEVSPQQLADLQDQQRTIDAALAKFTGPVASKFDITSSTPEPK